MYRHAFRIYDAEVVVVTTLPGAQDRATTRACLLCDLHGEAYFILVRPERSRIARGLQTRSM